MKKHKLYNIWNQVPVDYYQTGIRKNFLQKLWHSHKINLAEKLIKTREFKNCLDVGCNSGYMLSQLQKKFPKASYVGVDIYDKAIDFAKENYPAINFKVADATRLPFKTKSFDLVTFYETIEHVENPKKVLKELRRILTDSGALILAMDSGSWLFRLVWFIWENTRGKVWKGAHLHPFTHLELERLIIKAGFRVKRKVLSFFGMEVTFVLTKARNARQKY